ncbi:CoA transferase [Sulfobacillus harzensis]|uniref:CoA transferase n=1 Tax=Sulfobacillus harzensis TaxID=2729629 RepID=A0A7Y0L6E1_9FIRM|nr:CoA transferase [Sulfobacillus harzensis]
MSGGPLRDIHVLDLSRVLAAPYATMALGELGADVIKVERRPDGDETRQWGPPFVAGESTYFLSANRNKRSIALDLRNPDDQAVVRDLARNWADVVVENFKPRTLERWGLGLESLRQANPRLITASLRGYPAPDDSPGYDFVIQAGSGLMSITGPVDGEPAKVGVAVSDLTAGLFLLNGILAAMYERERTGKGDHVEVSLFGAQLAGLINVAQSYLVTGDPPQRYGNAHAQLAPYQTVRTADGWMALGVGNDSQFQTLCRVLGKREWADDPRFRTNPDRVAHRGALILALESVLQHRTTGEWVAELQAEGVPAGPVRTIPEAIDYAQASGHDLLEEVAHPTAGRYWTIRLPWNFSRSSGSRGMPPPRIDEHRQEILTLVETIRRSQGEEDYRE